MNDPNQYNNMQGPPIMAPNQTQGGPQVASDQPQPMQQQLLQQPLQGMQLQQPQMQGSVEQQALNGGGATNKQQISNFMNSLNQVGAGNNNSFMHSQNANQSPVQNLVDPRMAMLNNGGSMQNSQAGAVSSPQPITSSAPSQQYSPNFPQQPINVSALNNPNVTDQIFNSTPQQQNPGITSQVPSQTMSTTAPQQQQPLTNSFDTLRNNQQVLVSDETKKTNISDAKPQIQGFLDSIKAHNYEYKNKDHGVGQFTSPMAQELEATDLGKQAVIDTPEGKKVDYARLGGLTLAAVSVVHRENQRLQNQFDELKKGFKK